MRLQPLNTRDHHQRCSIVCTADIRVASCTKAEPAHGLAQPSTRAETELSPLDWQKYEVCGAAGASAGTDAPARE